jgi:hypothetical protein
MDDDKRARLEADGWAMGGVDDLLGPMPSLHSVLRKHGIDPDSVECGAECGDGWSGIVDRLLTDLRELGWKGRVAQVKEKLGTLRFYVTGVQWDERYHRISAAEEESARTCEYCGAPGKLRHGGWLKTLCDHCQETRYAAR